LSADVIDLSDRVLAQSLLEVFGGYSPPNASDFPESSYVANRLWPRTSNGWTISYNAVLATNPPRSWADLASPEYTAAGLGQTIALAGAGPFTRVMFEREIFGRDYWIRQAALKPKLYPSQSPMADALIRGEIGVGPLVTQAVIPLEQQGAPLKWFFGPEGVPVTIFCAGIVNGCAHPNAARLFMDWSLSPEGQALLVTLGAFSALKDGPVPPGVDKSALKPWIPSVDAYARVVGPWTEEWNHDFGYRQ
jgi:iron(III) transport system substrate-binding protein